MTSELSVEIKCVLFQAVALSVLLYGCTPWNLMKLTEKNARWELNIGDACSFERIHEAAPYKAEVAMATYHLSQERQVCPGEVKTNS